jgi:hypothetical protein
MKFITYSLVQRLFWSINLAIIYLNIQELSIAQIPPQSSQSITTKVSGKAVFGIQGRTSATTDLTTLNGAIGRDGLPETTDPASNIGFVDAFQFEINTQFPDRSRLVIEFEGGNGITNANNDSPFSLNNSFNKLGYIDNTNNRLNITNLAYRWQATDKLIVIFAPTGANSFNIFKGANKPESFGKGAIASFSRRNPIVNIGRPRGGIGYDWKISDKLSSQGFYSAATPNDPSQGNGIIGLNTLALQLNLAPTNDVDISLAYVNSITENGTLKAGVGDDRISVSDRAKFATNAIGATLVWRVNPKLSVGTWGGYTSSNLSNGSGNVATNNWMLFAKFPDLFQAGNLGGIYLGQPPKIIGSNLAQDGVANDNIPSYLAGTGGRQTGGQSGNTTHLEVFYQIKINDNMWITPGAIVIFNPLNSPQNPTITIGTIRTTFNF